MPFEYYEQHRTTKLIGKFSYITPKKSQIETASGDIINVEQNNRALDGDYVYYEIDDTEVGVKVVGIHKRAGLKYVGVLELHGTKMLGMNSKGIPQYLMTPLSWRFPKFTATLRRKHPHNLYVVVAFKEWLTTQSTPCGNIELIIGPVNDSAAENLALLHKSHLYIKSHDKRAVNEMEIKKLPSNTLVDYDDVIVIDPEGATDLDDGFSVDAEMGLIYVHIAEPNYYLKGGYNNEIMKRVTSIYGHNTYHMLPSIVASDFASLNKDGPKAVMTVTFKIKNDLGLEFQSVSRSYIKVSEQHTYETAQMIWDSKRPHPIRTAVELVVSSMKGKCGAGEDADDNVDMHKIVEYLMINTNSAIGKYLFDNGLNFSRYCEFKPMKGAHGRNNPCLKYVKYRTSKAAEYTVDKHGHGGLNLEYYTHFTSPIRRWADMLAHEAVSMIMCNIRDMLPEFKVNMASAAGIINKYNRQVKMYYRDRDVLTFFRKLQLQSESKKNTAGYIVDFKEETRMIFVYFPDFDIEYRYPLYTDELSFLSSERIDDTIHITNKQTSCDWCVPMFEELEFNLTTLPSEIRLNKKIVMRIADLNI